MEYYLIIGDSKRDMHSKYIENIDDSSSMTIRHDHGTTITGSLDYDNNNNTRTTTMATRLAYSYSSSSSSSVVGDDDDTPTNDYQVNITPISSIRAYYYSCYWCRSDQYIYPI